MAGFKTGSLNNLFNIPSKMVIRLGTKQATNCIGKTNNYSLNYLVKICFIQEFI